MSVNRTARRAIAASVFTSAVACVAPAHGADPIGISGYELYNGDRSGDVVRNVLFAGSTNAPCNCFTRESDGGTWVARVSRTADAGIGTTSTILGGRLTVDQESVTSYRITGGTVTWPASLDQNIGCGPGVAYVQMTLSRSRTFAGCLDDTHLNPFEQPFVFPPRIWGTLQ